MNRVEEEAGIRLIRNHKEEYKRLKFQVEKEIETFGGIVQ